MRRHAELHDILWKGNGSKTEDNMHERIKTAIEVKT